MSTLKLSGTMKMNEFYRSFIETGKRLALEQGLVWDLVCDSGGKVVKDQRWNLTALVGMVPPPTAWLSDLGPYGKALPVLNEMRARKDLSPLPPAAMAPSWRELFQATVINELLVKKNKPKHATDNVGRFIRVLAACVGVKDPWKITGSDVQLAYNVALGIGASGKLASNFAMVIRTVIDAHHLTDQGPLARFCTPFPTEEAKAAQVRVDSLRKSENSHRSLDRMRSELQERKRSGRLPGEKAFWELVRIVFTTEPKSFSDAIRFAQIKIGIVTGFRVGENSMIPYDWERWREYVDINGRPAGDRGGISRSLMIRHFAEKREEDERAEGVVLYETAQHVPEMYRDVVLETLNGVAHLTKPLRDRLHRQTETGRLLPEFDVDDLLPATEIFTRFGGSIQFTDEPLPAELVKKYRSTYDTAVLDEMWSHQLMHRQRGAKPNENIRKTWSRYVKDGLIVPRNACGDTMSGRGMWGETFFRIGEVEDMVRQHMPTKLPDVEPFTLSDGRKFYPYELMFLMPIRALIENRNDGVLDVIRYFTNGRVDPADLQNHLGLKEDNLFTRYGETEEDMTFKIDTHMLRHLQNGELFRLGVADTIITKRFRKSVAQSYEYDHRSLAEDLEAIDIPSAAEERMGPRAQEALRLIMGDKVHGPVVDEFRRIQCELGDDAAFDYLDAEADGLHVTPYGFCLNSFTVDPCPRHIECFNGCRHLARSDVPEEQHNLERMRDRLVRVIDKIEAMPPAARNVGWQNQLKHARTRLENIEKALAARPGTKPFPDGPDLFRSIEDKAGTTIMDTARRLPRAED
ncbi:hypothetical protein AAFN88_14880 [Pelagibius sp. CAU 1746]|uniref:hypothetical protein n=1 Tax=Pelagibius sp. CAU 1746 TaxID=3140370 RepID=UPI00325C2071